MSGTATLTWFADRGFELDLAADLEDIQLRFAALPVPADGTVELEAGVELNKIDILFKCQAAIDGAPAQLQEASVAVSGGVLRLHAKLEDVENGLLFPLEAEIPCPMPSGVPAAGGPRNQSPDEDDLDWGDETTFEQVAGDVPDAALLAEDRDLDDDYDDAGFDDDEDDEDGDDEPAAPGAKGVAALLAALKNLDADAPDEDEPTEERPAPAARPTAQAGQGDAVSDQKLSETQEALGLVQLLIDREELELEDEHDASELGPGVAAILRGRGSDEGKASKLSAWLLDQPAVADLFIDDESLAALISEW